MYAESLLNDISSQMTWVDVLCCQSTGSVRHFVCERISFLQQDGNESCCSAMPLVYKQATDRPS